MARRAGSLATERTDYSDRRLFPGSAPQVPVPFVRLEDFQFTSHNSLLPPTTKMVELIDLSRRADGPYRLDETGAAMLELELTHCVTPRPLADNEPASPFLRMAILWGRLAEVAPTGDQARRARQNEERFYDAGVRDLFWETAPGLGRFGYRYGWSATMILERFAETAEASPVAELAWNTAAEAHARLTETSDRRLRRAHEHMIAIDRARAQAVVAWRQRSLVGHGENVVSLRGRAGEEQRRTR